MTVAAAVLAAGRGVRFGGPVPKPLRQVGGEPLLIHALRAARASGLPTLVCVVSDERVAAVVPSGVVIARNDAPERGISSSLHAALRALEPDHSIGAVVIGLADQPRVGGEAYARVASSDAELAVATYGGRRANPVRIARSRWPDALALTGDEGARALFGRFGVAEVPCDGTGVPDDIDTPEDLAELESTWRSQTASE
jgi:CTP:molybdopterin cytidylyltransferase MocA